MRHLKPGPPNEGGVGAELKEASLRGFNIGLSSREVTCNTSGLCFSSVGLSLTVPIEANTSEWFVSSIQSSRLRGVGVVASASSSVLTDMEFNEEYFGSIL